MAATNDYTIRLIVRGEDLASQVTNRVAQNLGRDAKNMQKSSRETRKELDALAISLANMDRALKSKAESKRRIADILGFKPSEITDELRTEIINIRRLLSGELGDRKEIASVFGIDEKEVQGLQDRLELFKKLAVEANKEIEKTRKGGVNIRSQKFLGVPFEDQEEKKIVKTLGSGKQKIVGTTEAVTGLATQIGKAADEQARFTAEVENTKRVFTELSDLANRIDRGDFTSEERLAAFKEKLIRDKEIVDERLTPARTQKVLADIGKVAAEQARFDQAAEERLRRSLDLRKEQTVEIRNLFDQLRALEGADFLEDVSAKLRALDRIEQGKRRLALPVVATTTEDEKRTARRAEIDQSLKVQQVLTNLERIFDQEGTRKALRAIEALEILTSEFRKSTPIVEFFRKELNLSEEKMSVFNRKVGSLTRGFFQLDTWLKQRNIQFERDKLEAQLKVGRQARQILAQQLDARIEDPRTGARRLPRGGPEGDKEFKDLEQKFPEFISANKQIGDLDRRVIVLTKDVDSLGNSWFRAGGKIRNFVNQSNQLINARWFTLISLWTIMVTVLIQLAVALVEVGSSAVKAGAALGGAFVAGALQALSVIGLLQVAFSRIGKVFDLAAQQDELRIGASREAQEQAEAEADAQDRLADALEDQQKAVEDLADARKQAARSIVDAALREADAALSLQEAQLGVVQAKERLLEIEKEQAKNAFSLDFLQGQVKEAQARLALAQQQGQEAEISAASQQLSIAQQNLNAFIDQADNQASELKNAQLAAERAELNLREAVIENKRAKEDNKEAKAKGVEGSDEVVAALERIEDATEAVADARENLIDVTNKQVSAQEKLQDELADLTAAERSLFNTVVKVREKFRTVFRPITDIIVRSVDEGIQKAATLLDDKRILNAVTALSTQIGVSLGRISDFAVSEEARKSITFFTNEASRNLPLVTDALLNIAKAFLRIGVAASPLLRDLLERFVGLTARFEKFTRNGKNLEKFFASAGQHLNAWINLSKAIVTLLYEIGGAAAPSGKTFIETITKDLEGLIKKLRENKEETTKFFEEQRKNLEEFIHLLAPLAKNIFETFTSGGAEAFVRLIAEVLIPALGTAVQYLGYMSVLLEKLATIPGMKQLISFLFAWGIFTRVVPALRNVDAILVKMVGYIARKGFFNVLWATAISGAKDFGKVLTGGTIPLMAKFRKAIASLTAAQLLFNKAVLFNPYVRIAFAIGLVVVALIKLETEYKAVSKFLSGLKKDTEDFLDILNTIDGFVVDIVINIIDGATGLFFDFINWLGIGDQLHDAKEGIIAAGKFIGKPFGETIKESAVEGVTGLGNAINEQLVTETRVLDNTLNTIKQNLGNSLRSLQGLISSGLDSVLYEPTPAAKEAERIRKQEAARDRQQQVQGAVDTTKAASNEVKKAEKEVNAAKKALRKADTAEEKKEAKARLATAQQNYNAAKAALKSATDQEKEIKHDAAVSARLDYLDELDREQREAVQKRVESARKQANALFGELFRALDRKDWTKVQAIFKRIVKLDAMELIGQNAADAIIAGIEKGLERSQGKINKAVAASQEKAAIAAKKNRIAKKILGQTSVDDAVAGPFPSSSSKLHFLLSSGNVDLEMAAAILRSSSNKIDRRILSKVFKELGVKIPVKDVLKKSGLSAEKYLIQFLENHPNQKDALKAFANAVIDLQIFQHGGQVKGQDGQAVPVIAHVGEWVLNKGQQSKLARKLNMSVQDAKMFLFGSGMDSEAYKQATSTLKPSKTERNRKYETFELVAHDDDYGQTIWFIEFDDGAFGQVRAKDAKRIIATGGQWVPGYVRRSGHGFTASYLNTPFIPTGRPKGGSRMKTLAKGGEILANFMVPGFSPSVIDSGVQSFAAGGVVTASPQGVNNGDTVTKTVNQNFNVKTEGETDWNYVLRLGAIHAVG